MSDVEVSWHPTYNIHINNMDGDIAFHLGEALKQYLKSFPGQIDDLNHSFERLIDICETINNFDDGGD